jgi:hypothetical protein
MSKKLGLLFVFLLLYGCAPDSDLLEILSPSATINLSFPENLSECTEGIVVSETESEITFLWEPIERVTTYSLHLTNLRTDDAQVLESKENGLTVPLLLGTPYTWYVTSASNPDKIRSEEWFFYNAGPGVESFVPFPATALSPAPGSSISVTSTAVNLTWNATDLDDDIVGYDLYFGETQNPPLLVSDIEGNRYFDIPVSAGQTYFWQVVTKDSKGHESTSAVFTFLVG